MSGAGTTSQAPDWLAGFLMQPPLWFKLALVGLTGLCLALAARRVVARDMYIERDEMRAIVLVVATAEGVAAGVVASMGLLGLGYVGDVLVGLLAGFVAVEIARRVAVPLAARVTGDAGQLTAAWLGLLGGAIGVQALAGTLSVPFPGGLDLGVGVVAVTMLVWTVFQELGDGETLGEALREMDEQ